jgi:gamma-glutamylcyclotransferase
MKSLRYFAYGSNMLTRRISARDRAPSAAPLGVGYLEGRRLTFDKLGRDGSGKCDAELTGNRFDRVYGVVFEVRPDEKRMLDRTEGLGRGYEALTVDIVTRRGTVSAATYIATRKERLLQPYHWYKAITVAGALEHGLPADYREWLAAFGSVEDPNEERRAENEALLGTYRACLWGEKTVLKSET